MHKPFEHTLSPESRAAISTSLFAAIAYCAAIAIVGVAMSFAGTRSKDDSSIAHRDIKPDVSARLPL